MRVNVAKLLRVEIDEDLDLQIKTLNFNNKFTWCFHKTKQAFCYRSAQPHRKLKACLNGCNMLDQHHPTSLCPTCWVRLNTMLDIVALCWMMLDQV